MDLGDWNPEYIQIDKEGDSTVGWPRHQDFEVQSSRFASWVGYLLAV